MQIRLQVRDELYELEKNLGVIKENAISQIAEIAEKENMSCLSFLSLEMNTIFNTDQVHEIQDEELNKLRKHMEIDSKILDQIYDATKVALEDVHLYLHFEVEK